MTKKSESVITSRAHLGETMIKKCPVCGAYKNGFIWIDPKKIQANDEIVIKTLSVACLEKSGKIETMIPSLWVKLPDTCFNFDEDPL